MTLNPDSGLRGGSYRWWVLFAISLANFSAALDMSVVTVSLPRLTEVFDTDMSVAIWLVIAFSVAELSLMLTLARVGDSLGRKKVYLIGVALYTLGLVLCTISPNISMLIASRAVQGAGAAMILTVGAAIVVAVFPQEQQGRAIGLFSVLMSAGLIAGPALGGVIIDYLDWQGIFFTRIPVGIICIILAWAIVHEQKDTSVKLRLDLGGAITLLGSMACLLLYLNMGDEIGYASVPGLSLLIGSVVFMGLFIFIENRVEQPVLDLKLFKNRTFNTAGLTNVLQMVSGSMGPILFPFLMISGLLWSPSTSGILMAIIAVPPLAIAPIAGWISDKFGHRMPMIFATGCFTASLYLGSRLGLDTQFTHILLILILFGVGMGSFQAPNQSAIISAAPRNKLATTLGVANTIKILGGSIGITVAGTVYAQRQAAKLAELSVQNITPDMAERLSVASGYQDTLLLAAIISALSIIAAIFTGRKKSPDKHVATDQTKAKATEPAATDI